MPDQRQRERWFLSAWWLFLPAGIGLIVVGIVAHSSPITYGGPIAIGVACLFWGVAGFYAHVIRRTPPTPGR